MRHYKAYIDEIHRYLDRIYEVDDRTGLFKIIDTQTIIMPGEKIISRYHRLGILVIHNVSSRRVTYQYSVTLLDEIARKTRIYDEVSVEKPINWFLLAIEKDLVNRNVRLEHPAVIPLWRLKVSSARIYEQYETHIVMYTRDYVVLIRDTVREHDEVIVTRRGPYLVSGSPENVLKTLYYSIAYLDFAVRVVDRVLEFIEKNIDSPIIKPYLGEILR